MLRFWKDSGALYAPTVLLWYPVIKQFHTPRNSRSSRCSASSSCVCSNAGRWSFLLNVNGSVAVLLSLTDVTIKRQSRRNRFVVVGCSGRGTVLISEGGVWGTLGFYTLQERRNWFLSIAHKNIQTLGGLIIIIYLLFIIISPILPLFIAFKAF